MGASPGDEGRLFELLTEGAQAGLLVADDPAQARRLPAGVAGFDPEVVAGFGDGDVERLLGDAGIVGNRAKIESTISNARVVLAARKDGGFAELVWRRSAGSRSTGSRRRSPTCRPRPPSRER